MTFTEAAGGKLLSTQNDRVVILAVRYTVVHTIETTDTRSLPGGVRRTGCHRAKGVYRHDEVPATKRRTKQTLVTMPRVTARLLAAAPTYSHGNTWLATRSGMATGMPMIRVLFNLATFATPHARCWDPQS